jgi:hypothetical protein
VPIAGGEDSAVAEVAWPSNLSAREREPGVTDLAAVFLSLATEGINAIVGAGR